VKNPSGLAALGFFTLLGDASMSKNGINGGTCIRFVQSTIHKDYLLHLYEIFFRLRSLNSPLMALRR